MAKTFTEWLTRQDGSEDLVTNQLEQYVSRIVGVLHDVEETKRAVLIEKLISDLRQQL